LSRPTKGQLDFYKILLCNIMYGSLLLCTNRVVLHNHKLSVAR